MKAVGEVLESHHVTQRSGEPMADAVARALGLSDTETERWLESLSEGCTVEVANARAGIATHRAGDPLLVALARAIGRAMGNLAAPQREPLKNQGDKLDT